MPISGAIAIAGALSIILGYKIKIGSLLIVLFLVPVSFAMHPFWKDTDPMTQQIQMSMFMKNVSMLGGALFFFVQGAGAYSLDTRKKAVNNVGANHLITARLNPSTIRVTTVNRMVFCKLAMRINRRVIAFR